MDIYKFKEKLQRYLDGTANETERALIEAWYRSYDADERQLRDPQAWLLEKTIRENIEAGIVKKQVRSISFLRIAASVAIITTISLLVWKYGGSKKGGTLYYTVTTGTGGIKKINLPDGSIAWLNAASRIQVPVAFEGKLREIELIEGEGFFEVQKDRQHPFIVHAGHVNVQVLGTSFNIRNYKKLTSVIVSVATGKVGVTQNGHTLGMLLPGQQLSYDALTNSCSQQTVATDHAQSWKQGYADLQEANFNELSLVIKNMLGLNIQTRDKRIQKYHFSLRVSRQMPASQLLKIISQLHHTKFRKEGNDIILY
ncbi:FecR family protein [Mucilaginibacter sp. UR6-11]|uniref:FecR family protein n=1 Tax=Mucilaginibacter sp. UR6-11 TaxID=1435644 RepID=UPI001E557C3E|nr:FecR family protein [Mucilaginibacter sp. UR6-11]MCC8423695.1 FecR domain-containing protein [Mucilaginibacter sp. UR6-11]